jgi:hypothetical protein
LFAPSPPQPNIIVGESKENQNGLAPNPQMLQGALYPAVGAHTAGEFALADRLVPIQEGLETEVTAAKTSLRYGLEAGVGTGRDGGALAEGR